MKTYHLLRNNQQTGPFSLEQIRDLDLQKHDLIWIEEQSFTWKYPSEILELRSFAPAAEFSLATVINTRKEKQILYFQLNYQELNYKKLCIESLPLPDAYLSDIGVGFEYMVNPISINQLQDVEVHINKEVNIEIPVADESVVYSDCDMELSYDNFVGEETIDVPEVLADESFLSSPDTFTRLYARTESIPGKLRNLSKLELMILSVCLVSFMAIGYLLSFNPNNNIASRKMPVAIHKIENPTMAPGKMNDKPKSATNTVYKEILIQQEKAATDHTQFIAGIEVSTSHSKTNS